jgi:hypothetical protein
MPVADSPDFQVTIVVQTVPTNDNPDWQITATGPGGTPLAGGYASLTGPGATATPGKLTQAGGLEVDDPAGDGFTVNTTGGVSITQTGAAGTAIVDTGPTGISINATGQVIIQSHTGPTSISDASATGLSLNESGTGPILLNVFTGGLVITLFGVPVFANNAAAIGGGLTAGAVYRTGLDPDTLCIVH